MPNIYRVLVLAVLVAAAGAGAARADSPPVGKLPRGPTSTIGTSRGELVAVALPRRPSGLVWRIARRFDTRVVRQIAEADVGSSVVLLFKAAGPGSTTVVFGLTRGETAKAFQSRTFVIRVR